jgi:ribonuclease BN (tRNA processing enzyme)
MTSSDGRLKVRFLGSGDAFGNGGRNQACILVETSGAGTLIDCGATSLTAMKGFGLDPSSIGAVIVSHYHADHYGGLPFLILDGQFSHRTEPLTVAGPGDVERRVMNAMEVAFPGSPQTRQRFAIDFVPLATESEARVGETMVRAVPAVHTPGSDAICLSLAVGGRVVAYSGDTEWTEGLSAIAAGADLLVCESYTWQTKVRYHLDHETLAAHRAELSARRLVLTHCGPEMLAHLGEAIDEPAHDGWELFVGDSAGDSDGR